MTLVYLLCLFIIGRINDFIKQCSLKLCLIIFMTNVLKVDIYSCNDYSSFFLLQ